MKSDFTDSFLAGLRRKVYGVCLSWTKDPNRADDLTQDVMLRIWTKLEKFEPGKAATFETWAYVLARNVLVNRFKEDQAARRGLQFEHLGDTTTDMIESEFAYMYGKCDDESDLELRRWSDSTYEAAKEEARADAEVFVTMVEAVDAPQVKYRDVAERTGVPIDTVGTRVRRGRRAIAKRQAEHIGRIPWWARPALYMEQAELQSKVDAIIKSVSTPEGVAAQAERDAREAVLALPSDQAPWRNCRREKTLGDVPVNDWLGENL